MWFVVLTKIILDNLKILIILLKFKTFSRANDNEYKTSHKISLKS